MLTAWGVNYHDQFVILWVATVMVFVFGIYLIASMLERIAKQLEKQGGSVTPLTSDKSQ